MVSPHFPPDTAAATHRVRLLAPHLPAFGWEPTIVTVDPRDYEARLDPLLAELVPSDLEVVRVRAFPVRFSRVAGLGDLGLRAFSGLLHSCRRLLEVAPFDCLFVTIFPSYPALLGPLLKKRTRIPFILDYQDPWVGAWGLTAGPGKNGAPDLKSRISRAIATRLEPIAVRASDGITAVSEATIEAVRARIPGLEKTPCASIPLGGEPSDFEFLRAHPRKNEAFDPADGRIHLSYVGTLLPLGLETLRAFLKALVLLKGRDRTAFERLRVHFVGTSNQTESGEKRVFPEALRLGVESVVDENPRRVDYLDALQILLHSDAILLLGSSEKHYTASKLFPALLARRPLVVIFHRESTVVEMLRSTGDPVHQVVTYEDGRPPDTTVEGICTALRRLKKGAGPTADAEFFNELSARSMARRLSQFLDEIVQRKTL
jgi:hypothetical protein